MAILWQRSSAGNTAAGGQREWEPIRGAVNEIIRFGQERFSIEVEMELDDRRAHYIIEIGPHKETPVNLK